jgi:multicomponent Na+:H+ antiporter subunit D
VSALLHHLPILQVVVPLVAAPLCSLMGRGRLPWLFATLVSWLAFAISAVLLAQVMDGGAISYAIGDFAPPWGIEYRIDAVNGLVLLVVSGVAAVVTPYALRSVESEVAESQRGLFYTCWLLCLTGSLGIVATGDAFNVFVFLEISSLSTYALVAAGARRDRRALTAAYSYLVLGTVGATFFVIGVGMLYQVTGTLNMVDLAVRIKALGPNSTVDTGFAFIVAGMGLKLAMFPAHTWLPNAYTYAPSAVTAFVGATATKTCVYVLLRFLFNVFDLGQGFEQLALKYLFPALAIIAMFAMSVSAILQTDAKRLFAYSSIAQIGYIVLAISFVSNTGLTAAMLHVFNHALIKGALFMALGCLALRAGGTGLLELRGAGRRMPWTVAALVIGGLSLIGVPGTVGFVSKWYLILAAIEAGRIWIAALVVASSLLAVIYVWKLVEAAYLHEPEQPRARQEAPPSMLVPLWLLTLANVWFGIDTGVTVTAARTAAAIMLGATP